MPVLNPAGVFAKTNIQLPMTVILNPPMTAQRLGIPACCQAAAADEVTHLGGALAVDRPLPAAHAHRTQARPRLPPLDAGHVGDDHTGALLLATVAALRG